MTQNFDLDIQTLEKPVKLTGFSGLGTEVTNYEQVWVEIDKIKFDIKLYVINNVGELNIIIGRNFTENPNIVYYRIDELTLSTEQTFSRFLKILNVAPYPKQKNSLLALLKEHETCFYTNVNALGQAHKVKMKIEVTSSKPITRRPYWVAEKEKHTLREVIQQLLNVNIFRKSTSSYSSPVLLVKKK